MSGIDYASLSASIGQTSPVDGIITGAGQTLLPSYYIAADTHNYANGNSAFTDPSTWADKLDNGGKFVVAAAYSGVNSWYNSGVAIGNFFGADIEANDTGKGLADLDSDLGQYYQQNKQAIDLTGFIASSLVPGLAGVKLLNAGQKVLSGAALSGEIGGNLARSVGLLPDAAATLARASGQQIAATQATFSYINANTIKALGAGLIQNTLESAAFEVAVTATMFKSPVLEDQDGWDLAKNIATGAITGGVIGGAFGAAKTFGTIKKIVKAGDEIEKPFTFITELPSASTPSQRILQRYDDLANTPEVPTIGDNLVKLGRLRDNKIEKLNNLVRQDLHEMAGGDKELANQLADAMRGMSQRQVEASLQYAEEFGRVGSNLEVDKYLRKVGKTTDSIDLPSGTATKKTLFTKLTGEDAGTQFPERPSVVSLADTVKNADELTAKIGTYKFDQKKLWDATKVTSHLESEARFIWADSAKVKVVDGIKMGSHDIPMQERVLRDWQTQVSSRNPQELEKLGLETPIQTVNIVEPSGQITTYTNPEDFLRNIRTTKQETAAILLAQKTPGLGDQIDAIAKSVNVRRSWLEGDRLPQESDDLFASQSHQATYDRNLQAKGLKPTTGIEGDIRYKPSLMKMSYDTSTMQTVDGMEVSGMAWIKSMGKLYQQGTDNVVSKHMGELFDRLPAIPEAKLLLANRFGAGPGLFSFSQGGYGSLESIVQQIGTVTSDLQRSLKAGTQDALTSVAYKLSQNLEASIEFDAVNNLVSSTAEHYVLNAAGDALELRSVANYRKAMQTGIGGKATPPTVQPGAPASIPLKNQETRDAIAAHIQVNGKRVEGFRELYAAKGLEDTKDAATFYPIRPNPKDYPHFAFVTDPSVTTGSAGHVKMIHAASPGELESLIEKVPGQYKVITKKQSEDFFKAKGDYEYDRTLHENYIDADMKSRGVNSQFFQKTDPQKIVTDWVNDQTHRDDIFARELINAKYEKEFSELRRLGEQYTDVATSKYSGSYRYAENDVKNPYQSYVKTALNISQASENKLLYGFNQVVDQAFSRAFQPIAQAWNSVTKPADLDAINGSLQKIGVKTAYYDAATNLLANHSAPKNALSSFVRRSNGLLATLTLRMDPMNAINNLVGANVLLGAETRSVVNAINRGSQEGAGELAGLSKVQIPGMSDLISSPSKLIAASFQRYFSEAGPALKEQYLKQGWITSITKQWDDTLGELALKGGENAGDLDSRMSRALARGKSLGDKAEVFTGNKLAEELNRFVSADVMRQITDVGIKHGVINEQDALGYINSFVNRVQGNVLASQRPLMFHGAVGQAVGLFQSYQFNLMQNLFRHVAEGVPKDAAMLLGLQGTLYGLNGLPAFNFINTHIVGTASGNPNHQDLYSATYGVAGRTAGDWLLYGLPSNLLSTNLYSRGDINPRQASVIPTNIADIPIINATSTFFGNLKETAGKIGAGGSVWETLLQGIEHNGISRPLAGLAQVAQGFDSNSPVFSTNSKGTIMGSNDLFSIATLARIAGGRPLDEAIANDATYRISTYKAVDFARKQKLAETVKSSVIQGGAPDADQISKFAAAYAATGGKQKEFNGYMLGQIRKANTPMAEEIISKLKSPYSQNMQSIMGGRDITTGEGLDE